MMQSTKSLPIFLLSYTNFSVMIDDFHACCMRVMGHAYVWLVKVSRKPITYSFLTCIKKRLLIRYFMSLDKGKHSFAQLDRTLNQHHVNKKTFPLGTQWWLSLHPSSFCWPYFWWLELPVVSWSLICRNWGVIWNIAVNNLRRLIEPCLHRKT